MTETAAPPLPNPVIPEGTSTEALFNAFTNQEPGDPANLLAIPQQKQVTSQPDKTAPENTEVVTDKTVKADVKDDGIPDELIGGKKPEPKAEDDWDKFVKEEPQGQIKHEHYKRQREIAQKRIDALAAQVQQAQEKLTAAEKRGVPEDILNRTKKLEDTLAEREAVLERIAVQESPKFKERYTAKEAAITQSLDKAAAEIGVDKEVLHQAMNSSLKRRAALLEEVDPAYRGYIDGLMLQHDMLQQDKTQFLNQSREAQAQWQREQQEQMTRAEQERAAHEDKTFNAVLDEMGKKFAPFQEIEGNEQWNSQVRALREEAKKYFNGQVPLDELARAVVRGVGSPMQDKIISKQAERIKAMQEEIAALKTAQPGSNGHLPNADGKVDMSNMSADERARATWAQYVAPMNGGF